MLEHLRAWETWAPDITLYINCKIVKRHRMLYDINFFQRVIMLELQNADLSAQCVGDVVKAISTSDQAVGEV